MFSEMEIFNPKKIENPPLADSDKFDFTDPNTRNPFRNSSKPVSASEKAEASKHTEKLALKHVKPEKKASQNSWWKFWSSEEKEPKPVEIKVDPDSKSVANQRDSVKLVKKTVNPEKSSANRKQMSSWWKFWASENTEQNSNSTKIDETMKTQVAVSDVHSSNVDASKPVKSTHLTLDDVPDDEISNMVMTGVTSTAATFIPFSFLMYKYIKHQRGKFNVKVKGMNNFMLAFTLFAPLMFGAMTVSTAYVLYKYEFEKKSTTMGRFMRQNKYYDDYIGILIWPLEIPKRHAEGE